ncbi:MAG: hypothetical protein N2109_08000 [Fimbriimonadales bacterium]|nr:hypothetical protein [Fimbriimonadales bacterium]
MRRWGWFAWVLAIGLATVLWNRSDSPDLLRDTDTAVLLDTIRKNDNPWRWFVSDWPLFNHFYRPISTLTFELDRALWDGNAAGFGATNAALALLSIVLCYGVAAQLAESRAFGAAAATLFALWHGPGIPGWLATAAGWLVWLSAVAGLWRRNAAAAVLALAVGLWAVDELVPLSSPKGAVLSWIPGRTASSMTVFCLAAMACHAAWVRRAGFRAPRPSGPLDPPATRNTEPDPSRSAPTWPLWLGSLLFLALALGCYEQAVMLPGVLLGATLALRWRGWRAPWWPHAAHWALLAVYIAVRLRFVPLEASGYQEQQFRSGPGVAVAIFDYVLPTATLVWQSLRSLDLGWLLVFSGMLPSAVAQFGLQSSALARLLLARGPAAWAWALSTLAFLPMAWLKPFPHYDYWPASLRAAFAVGLWLLWWRLAVTAASHRAIPAPPRPDPAPGSLPRP